MEIKFQWRFAVDYFPKNHLIKLFQSIVERVYGAVERALWAYQLLPAPYQWPLYRYRRHDESQLLANDNI